MAHFDPDIPIGLACDARAVGIGAVVYHEFENGTERPIAYASKTLSSSEKNYSQIEREALSIIHKFTFLTDHKPLLTIFNPRKGIPTVVSSRLQRWAIILSAYTYDIQYKPTKEHDNADMLSRLPVGSDSTFDTTQSQGRRESLRGPGKIYVVTALIEYLTFLLEYIDLLGP